MANLLWWALVLGALSCLVDVAGVVLGSIRDALWERFHAGLRRERERRTHPDPYKYWA